MDTEDLGAKKMNNEQQINEGFSGENLPADYDPADAKLKQELETNENGDQNTVRRARNTEGTPEKSGRSWDENESLSRGVKDDEMTRKVENADRNSDIASNRYPESHPDNHENRGNLKLDDD